MWNANYIVIIISVRETDHIEILQSVSAIAALSVILLSRIAWYREFLQSVSAIAALSVILLFSLESHPITILMTHI